MSSILNAHENNLRSPNAIHSRSCTRQCLPQGGGYIEQRTANHPASSILDLIVDKLGTKKTLSSHIATDSLKWQKTITWCRHANTTESLQTNDFFTYDNNYNRGISISRDILLIGVDVQCSTARTVPVHEQVRLAARLLRLLLRCENLRKHRGFLALLCHASSVSE